MSAKHRDPEYRANARIIRQQVAQAWRRGDDVHCWRCRNIIPEQAPYDVGHINANGGHSIRNLAPEHRYRNGGCRGNRSAGGALGQQRQRARAAARVSTPTNGPLLGW